MKLIVSVIRACLMDVMRRVILDSPAQRLHYALQSDAPQGLTVTVKALMEDVRVLVSLNEIRRSVS